MYPALKNIPAIFHLLLSFAAHTSLHNKIEYVQLWDNQADNAHKAATYYTYDIHGNVDVLLQDINQGSMMATANRFKKIGYNYDLISGKVNMASYQAGYADGFYHRYSYDAENRLTGVLTSRDGVLWQHDAAYSYYRHGPLARTVLGELHVQGIDYAYTIQGWLKAINPGQVWHTTDGSCAIGGSADPGRLVTDRDRDPPVNGQYTAQNSITFGDGFSSAPNDNWTTVLTASNGNTCTTNNLYDDDGTAGSTTARDAMGLQLDYYGDADYTPISGGTLLGSPTPLGINFKPLYNGNIAAMMVNLPKLGEPVMYNYAYDQVNRLIAMDAYKGLNTADANWTPVAIDDYKERLSYDPNGNILTYQRNGTGGSVSLNNYTYTYTPGTNRLANINNSVNSTSKNYAYDEIGNVTKDEKQDVANAVWNLYGKLQGAVKTDGTQISYTYSADQQRISKVVGNTEEYYVRDATGNIMATYKKGDVTINGGNIVQTETHVYGSSRLGILATTVDCYNNGNGPKTLGSAWDAVRTAGDMHYEVTDHRGNVMLTVTDRLVPVPDASGTMIDHNLADVVSATDYSSFGAPLPGRVFGSTINAFNGQRKSTEIGFAAQTAEFWEYNADVGRRWNLDPINDESESGYAISKNNPVLLADPNGDNPEKPKEDGSKEGESRQTTERIARPHGKPTTTTETWFWHSGGVGSGKTKTVAGWYNSEDYQAQIAPLAHEFAGYQNMFGGANSILNKKLEPDGSLPQNSPLRAFITNHTLSDGFGEQLAIGAATYRQFRAGYVTGKIDPSAFNVEDMVGIGLLFKNIMKATISSLAKKTFYSVQSEEAVARLISGGHPWPSSPTQAHLGTGIYLWGSKQEAEAYLKTFSGMEIYSQLTIKEFSIHFKDFKALDKYLVPIMDDNAANEFLGKHSSLFGEGIPHGKDFIMRSTGKGIEYYFSSDKYHLLKIR